jgi:hypothetical protein
MVCRVLIITTVLLLGGCDALQHPPTDNTQATPSATDPDARTFSGTIISLRPTVSTMMISKEEQVGRDRFPNQVIVKYDAQTKLLLDGNPTTLDQIQQYMPVTIEGHMRNGQLFAETAKFSSNLPANVKRAATQPATHSETQPGVERPGQP